MTIDPAIDGFYSEYDEAGRLESGLFALERDRTRDVLERVLPQPPAVVADIGGGPGAHAFWLAASGFRVHLVDLVPKHVGQAWERSEKGPHRLASIAVGDARQLELADESADAVLLLGPLYHLQEPADRRLALGEARRVLRRGGRLVAAAISRYASLLDGMRGEVFRDPEFERIVRADLHNGRHKNDTGRLEYFTTAYYHKPEELAAEVLEAGFGSVELFGLEGPGALIPNFDAVWQDPGARAKLLTLARTVEHEPSLLGLSFHMLAVARR